MRDGGGHDARAPRGDRARDRDVLADPNILRTGPGREAVGIPPGERFLGLLHFGPAAREPAPREREPVESFVEFLP